MTLAQALRAEARRLANRGYDMEDIRADLEVYVDEAMAGLVKELGDDDAYAARCEASEAAR